MAKLADELRSEIMQQCKENTRSFLARREYVINEVRNGKREVFFHLAKSFDEGAKTPSRAMLDALGVPSGYRIAYTSNGRGVIYRNGKHYTTVEKRADTYPHTVIDTKEYCVEETEGFWEADYLYNEEELLDLGRYFEGEGFRVSINRHSDYHGRWPYTMKFFNICDLIVSL